MARVTLRDVTVRPSPLAGGSAAQPASARNPVAAPAAQPGACGGHEDRARAVEPPAVPGCRPGRGRRHPHGARRYHRAVTRGPAPRGQLGQRLGSALRAARGGHYLQHSDATRRRRTGTPGHQGSAAVRAVPLLARLPGARSGRWDIASNRQPRGLDRSLRRRQPLLPRGQPGVAWPSGPLPPPRRAPGPVPAAG
jgi:hypothetical protein